MTISFIEPKELHRLCRFTHLNPDPYSLNERGFVYELYDRSNSFSEKEKEALHTVFFNFDSWECVDYVLRDTNVTLVGNINALNDLVSPSLEDVLEVLTVRDYVANSSGFK